MSNPNVPDAEDVAEQESDARAALEALDARLAVLIADVEALAVEVDELQAWRDAEGER